MLWRCCFACVAAVLNWFRKRKQMQTDVCQEPLLVKINSMAAPQRPSNC